MNARFLQLSGVVIDLVHHIDHLPRSGEEVETPDMMVTAGGGFNAMQAARRMGIDVSYGGSLGTGMFADIAAKALADAGIGTLPLARQAIDQGTCAVLVDSSGERSFISHHGAERKIDAAGLDAIDVSEGDWILLTGYSLFKPETAAAFLPWLQRLRQDANFIFDPGPVVAEIPAPALNVAVAAC